MNEMGDRSALAIRSAATAFFQFMAMREKLRLRKEAGGPWPWSDDAILNTYKFTNVKREHDRTTRWMRQYWTGPNEHRPAGEIIFNCGLFRYFGTVKFAEAIGWQRKWDPAAAIEIAVRMRQQKQRIFTSAYIVPTLGLRLPKHVVVCERILLPLWSAREHLASIAKATRRWHDVCQELRKLPGFGGTGFMAKELLQDAMQTPVLRDAIDVNTWCPVGPGARRGLNRIFHRAVQTAVPERQMLQEMLYLFERAARALPRFMPTLELHDIQFQLCEFDKYERVRRGEGRPKSLYRRSVATKRWELPH